MAEALSMRARAAVMTLAALCCGSAVARGQEPPPAAVERPVVIKAARELMEKARYCALVTVGQDGHPQARIVDPLAPEGDMTVWIATNPSTRKVGQIKKDARVTLLYFDRTGPGYVTLLGTAEVISDAAEKAKRWKEDWAPFYKDKNRGDDYVLIRVKPSRLEIVSEAHGLRNDPKTWRPLSLEFE
jgi:general stress protein 26